MNFFNKNNRTYISLQAQDLQADPEKLWEDLQYTLQRELSSGRGTGLGAADGGAGGGARRERVTIRLYDAADITLKALSTIVSLGLKLKHEEVPCEFEATGKIIALVRKLNFASSFAQLTESPDGN